MPLNLLTDPWLPVVRAKTGAVLIRPAEIVSALADDPVLNPNWPRADLNIATYEFLIGLIFAAMPAESKRGWLQRWEKPPTNAELDAALAPFAAAFNLDGEGPRFLQDIDDLPGDPNPCDALFIDSAGDSTRKKNADLMVKRDRYQVLSRPAAAMALYTLQAMAPAGGAGNRTSMRGGGPLITLVRPPSASGFSQPNLWQTIWANTPLQDEDEALTEKPERAFPWLKKTRTSEKDSTYPEHGHPVQQFFGMPRRIRLVFERNSNRRTCDLTDMVDDVIVTGFVQRPWGVNYAGWEHPLTPYYRTKPGEPPLPRHPSVGRFGYRQWIDVAIGKGDGLRMPAAAVEAYIRDRAVNIQGPDNLNIPRLLVAGWAMDNMKPLDFIEDEQQLHIAATPARGREIDNLARQMAEAADVAVRDTVWNVRRALFSEQATVDAEKTALDAIRESFYDATEDDFHEILARAAAPDPVGDDELRKIGDDELRKRWLDILRRRALMQFEAATSSSYSDVMRGERVVDAKKVFSLCLLAGGR